MDGLQLVKVRVVTPIQQWQQCPIVAWNVSLWVLLAFGLQNLIKSKPSKQIRLSTAAERLLGSVKAHISWPISISMMLSCWCPMMTLFLKGENVLSTFFKGLYIMLYDLGKGKMEVPLWPGQCGYRRRFTLQGMSSSSTQIYLSCLFNPSFVTSFAPGVLHVLDCFWSEDWGEQLKEDWLRASRCM